MRRHEDMEATMKRIRSMEELPSPYLLNIVSRRWVGIAAVKLIVKFVEPS